MGSLQNLVWTIERVCNLHYRHGDWQRLPPAFFCQRTEDLCGGKSAKLKEIQSDIRKNWPCLTLTDMHNATKFKVYKMILYDADNQGMFMM